MKQVTIQGYETSDGKQFVTKEEAQEHQRRLKNTKVFLVKHNFDLTEGRGYFNKGLVVVTTERSHKKIVEDYCYNTFGERIGYVMGVVSRNSAVNLWTYHEVTDPKQYSDIKTLATIQK